MGKLKTETQMKKALKELKYKAPRTGVIHTKVVPDKTKYTRKIKHKGKINETESES